MDRDTGGHNKTLKKPLRGPLSAGSILPTGTVTFLFTDIQGSTPLWESQPELMAAALEIHNVALRQAIEANGGGVFKIVGDAFQAAFPTAPQALKAAIEGQLSLQSASWNALGPLKVRMGLHTGEAELDTQGDEYVVSHAKNRAARIMSAGHGGQILMSQEAADLCERQLKAGIWFKDLGEHLLKGLLRHEHLFQVMAPGLQEEFPPLADIPAAQHNLPRQLTPFIGREKEVEQLKALLSSHPLVTLTGSGGVGKTRLSIRAAEDLVGSFADGIWYIELAPLTDPKLVDQTVALTLGLRQEAQRSFQEALEYFLKPRQALLVLDNCEHLIEACARLADSLLRACPQVKLLASSREALGVAGEMVFHVPSLSLPDPQEPAELVKLTEYDAVRLFVERGQTALPGFQVTPQNAPAIAAICARLDGIPLALELAASRLRVLDTEQLASRLDDTFRLLVGGARTAVPRQQTLRATIDWSYRLLNDTERLLLRRLSVFIGGFTLEGAEAVCSGEEIGESDILDLLASLVNKSMVSAERVQGARTRYHLLETVRQYAREKLFDAGESETLRDRHLEYSVRFAEQVEPHIHGAGRLEWTAYLKAEHANLREALEWAFRGPAQAQLGLRIAVAITDRFWFTLNYREGEHWLKRGLQVAGENIPPPLLARTYYSLGRMMALKDRIQCQQYLDQCITLCREIAPEATRELALALSLSAGGSDPQTALNRTEEGVRVARTIAPSDVWTLAEALYFRSDTLFLRGYPDQAFAAAQESVRLVEMGDHWMTGGYWISGVILTLKGQPEPARKILKKALDLNLEVDDRFGVWYSLVYLGWHHLQTGELQRAYACCQDLLKLNDTLKIPFHFYDLELLGYLLIRRQWHTTHTQIPAELLDAARLLAAFETWSESYFTLSYEFIKGEHQAAREFLRQKIDPAAFESAWEEGRLLAGSLDKAVQYALSLGDRYSFEDHPA